MGMDRLEIVPKQFTKVLSLVSSKLYLVVPNSALVFSITVFLLILKKKKKVKLNQVYIL